MPTRALVGAYEIDFRIMFGDEVRWISARGQGNDADIVGRIVHGIFIDVTGRKQAEEGHEFAAFVSSHFLKSTGFGYSGLNQSPPRPDEVTRITSNSGRPVDDCLG